MKVTKKEPSIYFKSIEINIILESEEEATAFRNLASLDISIPEVIKENSNKEDKSADIIRKFLINLQNLKF